LLRFDARREGVTTQNWPAVSNSNEYGISRWIAGLWAKSIKENRARYFAFVYFRAEEKI
jgi:hypothetical protein